MVFKKVSIILLFLTLPLFSYADGVKSFRCEVKVVLSDLSFHTGYIYYGTFDYGYNPEKGSFRNYIIGNFKDNIVLYEEIKEIRKGRFNIDFVLEESGLRVDKNDIYKIELIEEICFLYGGRPVKVSKDEYTIIDGMPSRIDVVPGGFPEEYCAYIFISWLEKESFEQLVDSFKYEYDQLVEKTDYTGRKALEKAYRRKAIENDVVFFQSCSDP